MPFYRGKRRPAESSPSSSSSSSSSSQRRRESHTRGGVGNGNGGGNVTHLRNASSASHSSAAALRRRSSARLRARAMLTFLFVVTSASLYLSRSLLGAAVVENSAEDADGDRDGGGGGGGGGVRQRQQQRAAGTEKQEAGAAVGASETAVGKRQKATTTAQCKFRSYPPNRLYGLSWESSRRPDFLSKAAYIRGEPPIVINPIKDDNRIIATGGTRVVEQTAPVKVCLDTTAWENLVDERDGRERLPFTDGQNPSVVSLAPNPYRHNRSASPGSDNQHARLDHGHLGAIASALPSHSLDDLFLGVAIFGGGQCKFGLTPDDVEARRFSAYDEPPGGKRAVIAILAPHDSVEPFATLAQTDLLLERDAKYGTSRRNAIGPEKRDAGESMGSSSSSFARIPMEFDDPRLFFHLGRVWVLYRNGPLFGYEDQLHNPVHFVEVEEDNAQPSSSSSGGKEEGGGGDGAQRRKKFLAYVKASETVRICCGRNIALMSEEPLLGGGMDGGDEWARSPGLRALTWVDPVTVKADVDIRHVEASLKSRRRLLESGAGNGWRGGRVAEGGEVAELDYSGGALNPPRLPQSPSSGHGRSQNHRRLGSNPPKSNIHGTNGYMVPLPSTGELLGIAHFHRPENRKKSQYALHGHHYTHAFFTIARRQRAPDDESIDAKGDDVDTTRPFVLKRLSNEFVFRSNSIPHGEETPAGAEDADIIQFASGLDIVGSDVDGRLILSYGINDCEGSVFTLTMWKVQQMLLDVDPGQEVADLMEDVKRW